MSSFFHPSEPDSARFKLQIHRGQMQEFGLAPVRDYIFENRVDVLILRVDSTSKDSQSEVLSLGLPVIHADTLVYYELDLVKHTPNTPRNELVFEKVNESNKGLLSHMVPLIFKGYTNHYFSNPLLDKVQILEGYVEWALHYVAESEGRVSWLVKDRHGELYGFATCSFTPDGETCEGVLYGVLPEKSGGGVYGDLIRFTQSYFKQLGYKKMLVSTQVQNFAVQKVWGREGFYISKCLDTYHINAFLNPVHARHITSFTAKLPEVVDTTMAPGVLQLNPESHSNLNMQFENELMRALELTWPGKGIILLRKQVVYHTDIQPGIVYQLALGSMDKKESGNMQVVAVLCSPEGKVVQVAYLQVLKR